MKKGFVTVALMCFYGPIAVLACSSGSSGSGGGGGSVTSIDSSKQAGSLSDSDKAQYCKDATNYVNSAISGSNAQKGQCFSVAIQSIYTGGSPPSSDSDLQSKCKTAYNNCLANPPAGADAGATTTSGCNASDLNNCTATVGELNQCVQDSVAAIKAVYAQYDSLCDKIQLDGGGLTSTKESQPASCTSLEAKCPGLNGSSSKSSSQGSGTTTTRDAG